MDLDGDPVTQVAKWQEAKGFPTTALSRLPEPQMPCERPEMVVSPVERWWNTLQHDGKSHSSKNKILRHKLPFWLFLILGEYTSHHVDSLSRLPMPSWDFSHLRRSLDFALAFKVDSSSKIRYVPNLSVSRMK